MTTDEQGYLAGTCNIGDEEIARRRRTGHVGVGATVGLLGLLLATRAPRPARLVIALPAMLAAAGYLQAWQRFCAGYGLAGLYNFGRRGERRRVEDPAAAAADRAAAVRLIATAVAVGVGAAVASLALEVGGPQRRV
jgi:hypothetical protein